MPTSIKKQAKNAQTPLVVWLCSFNTVLTIMLHFGIKNTYKQRLFKYKGIGLYYLGELWRRVLAAVVIILIYLHSALFLTSPFYIDNTDASSYNNSKLNNIYALYCNILKQSSILLNGSYRTLQFVLQFIYAQIMYKYSFCLFVLYIDTVILIYHLK